jgi:HD-GYP domain-containing protein (c-di-GMP phosphodiesterase class II)
MVDAKDACTAGHSERVARIAVCVAKRMRLPHKAVSDIYLAGLLHDVGKVGVRDAVLLKPGALTDEETLHLREHTVIGDRIVSNIHHFRNLRPGVRNHHERFDGKGYPDGLAGEDIPLMARVLAVADACDAMMSSRRYRAALPPPQIDALFFELAGSQFDPQVVNHFMLCRHEIYPPIYQQGIGESAYHAVASALETGTHESLALLRVKGVEKHFSYE